MRARLSRRNLCRCLGSSIVLLSYADGSLSAAGVSGGCRFHRRCCQKYCAGTTRTQCSKRSVKRATIASTSRSRSPGLPRLDALDHHSITSVRLPERDDEQDRHLESQGEYRRSAGSLGRSPEKGNEGGCESKHSLVGDERHRAARAQRSRCATHGVGVVDHRHPHLFAGVIDVGVEKRIGHSTHDRVERNSPGGHVRAGQLPVADVPGNHHRAPALRHDVFDFIPSVYALDELLKPVFPDRLQQRRLYKASPQMRVRLARELHDCFVTQIGERRRDLFLDDALSDSERAIPERAELLADLAGCIPAQCAQSANRRAHRVVLGAVRQCRLWSGLVGRH